MPCEINKDLMCNEREKNLIRRTITLVEYKVWLKYIGNTLDSVESVTPSRPRFYLYLYKYVITKLMLGILKYIIIAFQ